MKKILRLLPFLYPLSSYAQDSEGLGEMADKLVEGPLYGLYGFMKGVCVVVGVSLLIAAFNKYRWYRRNPQEVPISTPIVYVLLGILMIALPFIYYLVDITSYM